jgi:hypothetical protein
LLNKEAFSAFHSIAAPSVGIVPRSHYPVDRNQALQREEKTPGRPDLAGTSKNVNPAKVETAGHQVDKPMTTDDEANVSS